MNNMHNVHIHARIHSCRGLYGHVHAGMHAHIRNHRRIRMFNIYAHAHIPGHTRTHRHMRQWSMHCPPDSVSFAAIFKSTSASESPQLQPWPLGRVAKHAVPGVLVYKNLTGILFGGTIINHSQEGAIFSSLKES